MGKALGAAAGQRFAIDLNTDGAPDGACVKCHRRLKGDVEYWVHMVDGGGVLAPVDEDYKDDGADLGWWVVGPECAKAMPAGFVKVRRKGEEW